MTNKDRQIARRGLGRFQRLFSTPPLTVPDLWEELCDIAALDPDLGELWLERQRAAVEDVRDWLARLEDGDDA